MQTDTRQLWQNLADAANALQAAGHTVHPANGGYIGPSLGPWAYEQPGLCVVRNDDTDQWQVEDRTLTVNGVRQDVAQLREITCGKCGDDDGPFAETPEGYICEGCLKDGRK